MSKTFLTEPKSRKRNPGFDPNMPKGEASLTPPTKGPKPKRDRKKKAAAATPDAFDLATPADPVAEPESVTVRFHPDLMAPEPERTRVAVLTKRITEKGGLTSYARPGVRASVYFSPGMFNGTLPETVTIYAEGLAEPGAAKAPAASKAEKAAKAEARAAKAVAKAEKAAARAAKAAAKAGVAPTPELVGAGA